MRRALAKTETDGAELGAAGEGAAHDVKVAFRKDDGLEVRHVGEGIKADLPNLITDTFIFHALWNLDTRTGCGIAGDRYESTTPGLEPQVSDAEIPSIHSMTMQVPKPGTSSNPLHSGVPSP